MICPACNGVGAYVVVAPGGARRPKVCAICHGRREIDDAKGKRLYSWIKRVAMRRTAAAN